MRTVILDSLRHHPAARTAFLTTLLVHLGYVAAAVLGIVDRGLPPDAFGAALSLFAAMTALHTLHVLTALRIVHVRWEWSLALQVVLTYAPFAFFGWIWLGMPGFLAFALLVLVPPPWSWGLFSVVIAVQFGTMWVLELPLTSVLYGTLSTALTGGVLFAMVRLAQGAMELSQAKNELAQMAVADERTRITRDLHDVLGRALSTIAIKGELVYRMVGGDPDARREITDITELARKSLSEVRAVVAGYRRMTLEAELSALGPLLKAAEIEYSCTQDHRPLPPELNELVAKILSEAATNALRHSKAQRMLVELVDVPEGIRLTVVNNGVAHGVQEVTPAGGLQGIEERAASVGGTVSVEVRPGETFTVTVTLPRPDM
uniref:sensor histidine kinase n=1 Tax=Herbidospora sakaeratensis TaxID=564415 RepID=UPI0007823C78|nr:sensor histidine kinase [Herbidospora sakaeratensis]